MADCGSNVEMEMVIDDDTSGRDADEEQVTKKKENIADSGMRVLTNYFSPSGPSGSNTKTPKQSQSAPSTSTTKKRKLLKNEHILKSISRGNTYNKTRHKDIYHKGDSKYNADKYILPKDHRNVVKVLNSSKKKVRNLGVRPETETDDVFASEEADAEEEEKREKSEKSFGQVIEDEEVLSEISPSLREDSVLIEPIDIDIESHELRSFS